MEIKVLNQTRDMLISVESIEIQEEPHHSVVLKGMTENEEIILGRFKRSLEAEMVLLNIVKRLNLLPDSICIIPEDDEDIINRCDVSALPGQVFDV